MACGGGVPDFENTDTIKRFADKINAVYEVASRNGFTMFLHNLMRLNLSVCMMAV